MMRASHGWLGLSLLVLSAGCGQAGDTAYVDYGQAAQRMVPSPPADSANTFPVVAKAADDAEAKAPRACLLTTFSPSVQQRLKVMLAPEVNAIHAVAGKPISFDYGARTPFQAAPHQKGWRLIGRVMVWTEVGAVELKDFDKAIATAIDATNFGFGLTTGDATDAALGLTIADDARRGIVTSLDAMTSSQLDQLAAGCEAALKAKPTLQTALVHEHANMLMDVQYVQDAYARGDWDRLQGDLGPGVRESIEYLRDMKGNDTRERADYFAGLAADADAEDTYLEHACLQPAYRRVHPKPPSGKRPWKNIGAIFFAAGEPLLAMNDATLARTRMLVITCRLMAKIKRNEPIPAKLDEIADPRLSQDPFSGRQFEYHEAGQSFRLYSVGQDFVDDGGETDPETFQTPDLTLERPSE
jgi:hypothetical protein